MAIMSVYLVMLENRSILIVNIDHSNICMYYSNRAVIGIIIKCNGLLKVYFENNA